MSDTRSVRTVRSGPPDLMVEGEQLYDVGEDRLAVVIAHSPADLHGGGSGRAALDEHPRRRAWRT